MNRLSKHQQAQLVALQKRFAAVAEQVETAYEDFKQRQQDAWEASGADKAVADFNSLLEEFESFREDVTSEMQDYFDARSEAWQTGDRGEDYLAWLDAWNDGMEDLPSDPPDCPDAPDVSKLNYPISVEDV